MALREGVAVGDRVSDGVGVAVSLGVGVDPMEYGSEDAAAMLPPSNVPDHVNESIEAIADLQARAQRGLTVHQRGIERLTKALGRPYFLYSIIAFVSLSM